MNRKKWLCVLLSLTMAFSLMPTAAFAAETETGQDSTAAAAESVQEAEEPPADKQEEAAPVETPAREQEDEDTEADPAQAEEEAALPAAEEPTGPADRDPAVPAAEPEEAGETEEAGEADTEAAALAEGDDTASEADRTVLQETISRAQALVQEDYTEESWKVFADALAAAQTTAEKAEAAQEEIDAAAKALEQAMADLKEEDLKGSGYVLMNIPYGKFYESEGCGGVDAVSSATKSKPRNGGLTAGSYHVSSGGDDISGIIYPVYVEDLSVLKDNRRITDRDSITITTTARGRTSTDTYNGREALFESESYSFYLLGKDSQPAGYKKLSGSNGSYSFGASTGSVSSSEGVTGSVSLNARHTDVEIKLSGLQVGAGESVSGVILTTEDGSRYPLRHLTNLWRSTEIGWNYDDSGFEDLAGKTITNIRYYMPDGTIADYPVEIFTGCYVLMNIPYAEFYAAEGDGEVDAVSSATKNKPLTGTLAGGSYHVSSDGSDISGIIYPVKVTTPAALADFTKVTDDSSVDITVTNRGQTSTSTYAGKEALFESPDHSYYVLNEVPEGYKELTVSGGSCSFGPATGAVSTAAGVEGKVSHMARHANVEISLTGLQVSDGAAVSGVVLTANDGSKYALRHVVNLWRSSEIGWNYDDSGFEDLAGKTITNIRYYMPDGTITDYPVQIDTSVEVYALMNIPYDDFYAAEGGSDIDAVSSATKVKSTDPARVGGSYHENSDGSDISGGTYPVKITSAKVLADQTAVSVPRGTEDADAYVKETLFNSPGYTYYVLAEQPAHYKELTVNEDGSYSFGEAVGEVKSVEGADGTPVVGSRHDDIEMKLSGVTANEDVAGVVVTTQDGSKYCLRHEANLWKGTQIGWNYDDAGFEDLFGKTITNLRYFHNDGAIVDYPCSIELTAYVLMNIPYAQFYAAEGDSEVDAVSSATKSKPRSDLAAGSYHVSSEGNDISGIIYPVKVSDTACLKGHQTANKKSTLSITVSLRGQEVTTDYTGSECLFEMPDYSYFGLDSEPVSYKEMTAGGDGSYSFGPATGPVTTVEGAEGAVTLNARHADTEIVLSGLQVEAGAPVSGVVLTTEDGSQYGLRHVVNLWRSTQIGWNNSDSGFEDIGRKTITNVRYYMPDGTITDYPVRIALAVGQYNELVDDHRIIRDDDDTEELFAAYLAAVSQVVVNGTAYDAAGDNAVRILDPATGELLLNAADRQAFPGLAENEVTLKADGYPDYSFRLVQPEITAGMHGQWTKGSKESLSFTSNAKFDYLREVRVDDAAIDPAHYTAAEGSTVIDLTPEYLETLAAGAHTIGIVSANGIASTDFTIVPAEEEEPAEDQNKEEQTSDPEKDDTDSKSGTSVSTKDSKGSGSSGTSGRSSSARSGRSSGSSHTGSAKTRTGDTANTGLWLLLICAAGAGMAVLLLRRRNRKN